MGTFTPQALKASNLSRFEGFFVSLVVDDLVVDDPNAPERLGSGLKKTQFLRNSYDMC